MDPEVTTTTEENTEHQEAQQPTEEQRLEALQRGFDNPNQRPTETPGESGREAGQEQPPVEYVQLTKQEADELRAAAKQVLELQATVNKGFGSFGNTLRDYGQRIKQFADGGGVPAFDMSEDEIAELQADFPPLAKFATKLKAARAIDSDSLVQRVSERLNPDDLVQQAEDRAWKRIAKARAAELHEDWEQVANSDEFARHVASKGDEYLGKVRAASETWDYRTITSAISDFKKAKQKAQEQADLRRQRINDNVNPRGTSPTGDPPRTREDALNAGFKSVQGRT